MLTLSCVTSTEYVIFSASTNARLSLLRNTPVTRSLAVLVSPTVILLVTERPLMTVWKGSTW